MNLSSHRRPTPCEFCSYTTKSANPHYKHRISSSCPGVTRHPEQDAIMLKQTTRRHMLYSSILLLRFPATSTLFLFIFIAHTTPCRTGHDHTRTQAHTLCIPVHGFTFCMAEAFPAGVRITILGSHANARLSHALRKEYRNRDGWACRHLLGTTGGHSGSVGGTIHP